MDSTTPATVGDRAPDTQALDWIAATPEAWRPALRTALSRGGVSSMAAAGLDCFRRAVHLADRAVEMLNAAKAVESNPEAAALFDNVRLSAQHLLVTADHVAQGKNLRGVTRSVADRGAAFGRRKNDGDELALQRNADLPFHQWAQAGGLSAPDPIADTEIEPETRRDPARPRPKAARRPNDKPVVAGSKLPKLSFSPTLSPAEANRQDYAKRRAKRKATTAQRASLSRLFNQREQPQDA